MGSKRPFAEILGVAFDYIVAMSDMKSVKQIPYTRSALKMLRRMPANRVRLIVAKVELYAAEPESLANNVVALKGRDGVRLRVDDWRAILQDDVVLAVLEIGHHGGVYE